MKRYLFNPILKDLKNKMVFVTGPRQVGKTFLSKQILATFSQGQYLNFDSIVDREIILNTQWRQNTKLLVFDEIHKMKDWKNFLKGVYDSKNEGQAILVTGSARLDTFRQTGDSLAGRYFHYRLNPVSVKELGNKLMPFKALERINKFGGFPEPLIQNITLSFEEAQMEANRWQNQYYTDLVREDILEFSRLREINIMRTLLELLRTKVGSPLSYNSIAQLLQVSVNTIKKYIEILESLYIIFLLRPFHKNVARSLLKEPKLYFYDTSYVKGDEGIKLENSVAVSLLKETQFLYDSKGKRAEVGYLKTKEGKEVDFIIIEDSKPKQIIEVKLSERSLSKSLIYFTERFKEVEAIQLVHNLNKERQEGDISIVTASDWLANLTV